MSDAVFFSVFLKTRDSYKSPGAYDYYVLISGYTLSAKVHT